MTTDVLRHGRYQIERPIGRGGMGTVHLARDTVLGRCVAVKVLAEHLAADDAFRQRFLREARLTAKLCHPNVVQVFDAGDDPVETGSGPFLVMEYVDGETVADRLTRGTAFTADEALRLALHLSAGLAHAHARGIVHRDVKPHNVLLRQDGVAKLTDFGIARALEESGFTQLGTTVGTARFMAPEQAAGQIAGPPADIYGLGAVLRHIGAGELSPALASVVDDCLIPDPAARPTAADLHRRLNRLAGTPALLNPPPTPAAGQSTARPSTAELDLTTSAGSPADQATALHDLTPPPGETALTEVAWVEPTRVAPGPPTPDRLAAEPAAGRSMAAFSDRFGWPILAAAAVLLILVALFLQGDPSTAGDQADTTPQSTVTPVPAAADPASSARTLADWLRDNAE